MDKVTFFKTLTQCKEGISEILLHPGYFDISNSNFDYPRQGIVEFLSSPERIMEIKTLTDKKATEKIKKNDLKLVSFKEAAKLLNH